MKEDHSEAKRCLKRYNRNCIKIINIKADIMSIDSPVIDGLPKAPYRISDKVLDSIIEMEEDEELQEAIKEYKAVAQAIQLVNKDSKYIFEEMYIKSKTKWEIINSGMSERTFARRKSDLILAVHEELKKMA